MERRGRDGLVGGRDGGRGGSLKTGVEEGIWGGGGEGGVGEGIGILLVLFLFLFLDLTTTLFGLGWKSGSSGSESFSGEEGGVEGGEGEGACRKKWGIVGSRGDFFRWYVRLQG